MEDNGLHYYNDVILINSSMQAGRISNVYFNRNRKVASTHQNILMFIKGNPDLATEDINWNGSYVCEIDGVKYKSYKEAAIVLGDGKMVGSDIKGRCESKTDRFKNWISYE